MSLEVSRLRALAHPVRLRILSLLTSTAMSASEIARELDITQANASYHLRRLAAAGEVVEAGEVTIRGGVAKRYRHPWEAPPESADGTGRASRGPDQDGWRAYVEVLAGELTRRSALHEAGRSTSTDAELWVDPQTWSDVVDEVAAAAVKLHAAAQAPRTEGAVRVNMTAALFRMGEDPLP